MMALLGQFLKVITFSPPPGIAGRAFDGLQVITEMSSQRA